MEQELDTRNLIDEYKGLSNEEVFERMMRRRLEMKDRMGSDLEVAIENVSHDFNIGTIVRNANSFNVAKVHIIGRKKYNRRGAMCTDKYLEIVHWEKMEDFWGDQRRRDREMVAIENNVERARGLAERDFSVLAPGKTGVTLIFGSEGDGISKRMLEVADDVRFIESFGSTRSVNVGVASGIAMYKWVLDVLGGSEKNS